MQVVGILKCIPQDFQCNERVAVNVMNPGWLYDTQLQEFAISRGLKAIQEFLDNNRD